MQGEERVRVERVEVLSDNHYVLSKATFAYRRADAAWETQVRESYDRGNGATILLFDRERRTVVLTRQFRYPAFAKRNGRKEHGGLATVFVSGQSRLAL